VGYLFLKEAYAEQRGSSEDADITKNARQRFISEHVSHCASGIGDRLKDSSLYLSKVFSWLIKKTQAAKL
jgi:hypothetical protein